MEAKYSNILKEIKTSKELAKETEENLKKALVEFNETFVTKE